MGCQSSPDTSEVVEGAAPAAQRTTATQALIPPDEIALQVAEYVPRPPNTLTFARDIAPIVFQNCAVCHRPGESAPFSLLSYRDVKKRARQVTTVTGDRYMPPWLAATGYNEFAGQRGLGVEQIGMIRQWVDEGAVLGNPADLPPVPRWTEGWRLGEPDLMLELPESYTLRADGPDVFRNFVIPVPVSTDRHVRAFEFRPGNYKIVHHGTVKVDPTRGSRRRAEQDPEPGFDGMDSEAQNPDGHFLGWVPGRMPYEGSESMSWRLGRNTDLVLELHLQSSGKPEPVTPIVGLHFAERAPTEVPLMVRLGPRTIDIPPGEARYMTQDSYTLPVDVKVLSVVPHAHYLGDDMKGWAVLPDGSKRWLIRIKEWDFNWQDEYRYAEPLFLPRGTMLAMQFTFDNSADNVRNPNDPPLRVKFGPKTRDEMGDLWIQVLPRSSNELAILQNDYYRFHLAREVATFERLVQRDPADPKAHNNLAHNYLQVGRTAEAIEHFQEALRIQPDYGLAQENLAIALFQTGELEGSLRHFRELLEMEPDHAEARANLAHVLGSQGRFEEAIDQYRRALEINPEFPRAHFNLGRALEISGRAEEALEHFEEALRQEPDWILPLNSTARILATHPNPDLRDPARAVELAERASELASHRDPLVLETLAAAYAAGGQFQRAVRTAQAALALVSGPRAAELAARIREGIERYRHGLPNLPPDPGRSPS